MARRPPVARTAAALLSAAAAAFGLPAGAAAPPQDGQAAVALVADIYHRYSARQNNPVDYDGREARRVFTPQIVALMRRTHEAHAGEALDWLSDHDIFCACQDFTDIHAKVRLQRLDGAHAWVAATIVDPPAHEPPRTLRFELVRGPGGWRIADLFEPGAGGLRRALDEDARRFPLHPRKPPATEPKPAAPRPRTGGG